MTTKEIRTELKKKGYNNNQVSVREKRGGYDRSFVLTVRDRAVNIQEVKEIAKSFESVSRCERSYEVLSGGNCWVSVEMSEKVQKELAEKYLWLLECVKELEVDSSVRIGRFDIYMNYNNHYQVYDLQTERFFKNQYYYGGLEYMAIDMAIAEQN